MYKSETLLLNPEIKSYAQVYHLWVYSKISFRLDPFAKRAKPILTIFSPLKVYQVHLIVGKLSLNKQCRSGKTPQNETSDQDMPCLSSVNHFRYINR